MNCWLSIKITPSKINLQPCTQQYRCGQPFCAWLCNLQISSEATPRSQNGIVIQLDALFIALCQSRWRGRPTQQILEFVRNSYVKVAQAAGVAFSSGNEAASAEADRDVPTNRIRVAVGKARHPKNPDPRVCVERANPEVLVEVVIQRPRA